MRWKIALKIVVSIGLLALLASRLDWAPVLAELASYPVHMVVLAAGLHAIGLVLGCVRWRLLIEFHGLDYRSRDLLSPYFVGAFFNNLLPSATGGDLYRMYFVFRDQRDASSAVSPVLTERVIGMITLVAVASAGVPFLPTHSGVLAVVARTLPILLVTGVAGLALIGSRDGYRGLHGLLVRGARFKMLAGLASIVEACHRYLRDGPLMVKLVLLSIVIQLLEVGIFYTLATGAGAAPAVLGLVMVIPVILASAAVPVTVGGFGVREAVGISLLTTAGFAQSDATLVMLLYIPVILLATAPGLGLFLLARSRSPLRLAEEAQIETHNRTVT